MKTKTAEVDGQTVSYNPDTSIVEVRTRLRDIRAAQRQPGWLVGNLVARGSGCYMSHRATVIRPLYPRELRARQEAADAAAKLAADKEAELAAMPTIAVRALREAICLRKGKVRAPAYLYEELTGRPYSGRSPYGPRLGRFLASCGVVDPVSVIRRHVAGQKPW